VGWLTCASVFAPLDLCEAESGILRLPCLSAQRISNAAEQLQQGARWPGQKDPNRMSAKLG
jgi:hypothetical protein